VLLRLRSFFYFSFSFLRLVYGLEYDSMGQSLLQYDAVLFVLASAWDHRYREIALSIYLRLRGYIIPVFTISAIVLSPRAVAHLFPYFNAAHYRYDTTKA